MLHNDFCNTDPYFGQVCCPSWTLLFFISNSASAKKIIEPHTQQIIVWYLFDHSHGYFRNLYLIKMWHTHMKIEKSIWLLSFYHPVIAIK